jgi:L-ascorbate metabolism protein UlaG (beta-lactamase superfamily)
MKPHASTLLSLALFASVVRAAPLPPDVIPAKGGPIRITPIYHASFQIEYRGKVIQVDPFSAGDYRGAKKADVILITHTHPDHLDKAAIRRLAKPSTEVVGPEAVTSQLQDLQQVRRNPDGTIRDGDSYGVGTDSKRQSICIDAVPAYNIVRGPKPGQKFHPKGQFNGYVLTLGGKRIYIAGDTEATPEMKALKNIDVAFLPMNLPYTMTPQEAASGARAFKPKLVYPYHYRYPFTKANNNPQQFANALKGSGIQVRLRDWYANPAKK